MRRWAAAVLAAGLIPASGSPGAVAQESGNGKAGYETSGYNQPAGSNTTALLSEAEVEARIAEAAELEEAGRYSEAAAILEQLLAYAEATFGPDHHVTATILNNLALLYSDQGLYSQADPLYRRALLIREKALGPDHPDTAASLMSLAESYRDQGIYDQAEHLHRRALAITEKGLGPDHDEVSYSLNALGLTYSDQGLYRQAEPLLKRALTIREKALGPDHPRTSTSINNLALLYSRQGLYSKAEVLYRRALEIRETTLGPDHRRTATTLNNLAYLYSVQGRYSQSEKLHKRVLEIKQKILGARHPSTATTLNNLALLYTWQGLLSQAEQLYIRALAIREEHFGAIHPMTANSLFNLASLYARQNLHRQAELLHKRALAIHETALGPDHPYTAASLNNLAALYSSQGLYSQAEPLSKRALAIHETALGPDHHHTAASLNNLAELYRNQGLYSQAEPLYKRALAIVETALGPDHPDTATSLQNLALHYSAQGLHSKAADPLARGLETETSWLMREAPMQPRSQRLAQAQSIGSTWQVPFTLADLAPTAPTLALTTRLQRHGLLLEIERAQAQLRRAPGPTQQLAQQVAALNRRLSDVQFLPAQRPALREQRDELERQLHRQLPELRLPRITPEQAAGALPTDGALVEFQRYRPWRGGTDPDQRWGAARYLALILRPDGSIRSVQLGEAAPIEEKIATALRASAEATADADPWAEVSQLVLLPLAEHLAGSRQWFLSPDAELHRVPFAALPSPTDSSTPLASAVQLRLLTTGRDLLRLQQPPAPGRPPVVIANPDYERRSGPSAPLVASALPQQRSGDLKDASWAALPATAAEGQQIASLLGSNLVSGTAASVALLERSISPRVLHIASHGFFESDQEPPPADLRSGLIGAPTPAPAPSDDPLLRSGIVLAGANNPGLDPNDDGLLTALEATALQLDGTELVVLSACSTGLGDIRTGEGLYGLQRALAVAGARTTLLSLWKVDDQATAEFMTRFYRRLKAGEGRSDALAAVQQEFRTGKVRGPSGEDWSEPYYWAAWQLVGDWRPIEGL